MEFPVQSLRHNNTSQANIAFSTDKVCQQKLIQYKIKLTRRKTILAQVLTSLQSLFKKLTAFGI
jgi:hypothetical protein